MIDCFLEDAFGVLYCQFLSTFMKCGARLLMHILILERGISGARFLTGAVFEYDIPHHRFAQYCVCCIRSGVIRCSLSIWSSTCACRMCLCGFHAVV